MSEAKTKGYVPPPLREEPHPPEDLAPLLKMLWDAYRTAEFLDGRPMPWDDEEPGEHLTDWGLSSDRMGAERAAKFEGDDYLEGTGGRMLRGDAVSTAVEKCRYRSLWGRWPPQGGGEAGTGPGMVIRTDLKTNGGYGPPGRIYRMDVTVNADGTKRSGPELRAVEPDTDDPGDTGAESEPVPLNDPAAAALDWLFDAMTADGGRNAADLR